MTCAYRSVKQVVYKKNRNYHYAVTARLALVLNVKYR